MHRINEDILNQKIRIVNGENNNVITLDDGLDIAYEQDLDLVEMSENDGISICKVMNYSKYLYEQKKAKKPQKKAVLKEIKLGCNIADHDIQISANKAKSIMNSGDKVKVMAIFKGRQVMFAKEQGKELLEKFLGSFDEDYVSVIKEPKLEGNVYSMTIEHKN